MENLLLIKNANLTVWQKEMYDYPAVKKTVLIIGGTL